MNFSRAITVWSEQRPEQTAIRFEGGSITYRELEGRIVAATAELSALGIRPGQRVAYLGLNHPVMLVLLFALCRLGAIFQPLNFRLSATEHARQLLDSTPSLFFHAQRVSRRHLRTGTGAPAAADGRRALWASRLDARDATAGPAGGPRAPPSGQPETTCTAGLPSETPAHRRGCAQRRRRILFFCINSIHCARPDTADHGLIVLPLFQVGGLNSHACCRCSNVRRVGQLATGVFDPALL
jgi:fatty-acyl-CoA synthase